MKLVFAFNRTVNLTTSKAEPLIIRLNLSLEGLAQRCESLGELCSQSSYQRLLLILGQDAVLPVKLVLRSQKVACEDSTELNVKGCSGQQVLVESYFLAAFCRSQPRYLEVKEVLTRVVS